MTKSFGGQSTSVKGRMLDAKAVDTCMLLDNIEKPAEAQILIIYLHKIRPVFDGFAPVSYSDVSLCSYCSSFEHVELDCPVMTIQGPSPFWPNPTIYLGLPQENISSPEANTVHLRSSPREYTVISSTTSPALR